MIWRLRMYNLFCKIFQFRDLRKFYKFHKFIIVKVFAIFEYFMKKTTYSDSSDHALQNDIQHV